MPDLNSVPASPHPQQPAASSRRQPSTTQQMSAATASTTHAAAAPATSSSSPGNITPSSSLNILPSNQTAVNPPQTVTQHTSTAVSSVPSPQHTSTQMGQQPETASGPGPLRHPRPMTASELHMELEKEQEALVNRLTRELSLLRATHNTSVASNASSASAATSAHDPIAEASLLSGSGFSIPTSRRHHRTSSTASQSHQLASSFEGRGTHFPRPPAPVPLSRQDSSASRSSQAAPGGGVHLTGAGGGGGGGAGLDPSSYFHQQRVPPHHQSASSVAATPGSGYGADHASPALMPATSRYEETAFYRGELEVAKRENDVLKKRVRELERMVRDRRESSADRHVRSESVSTTASASAVVPTGGVSIAGPRERCDAAPAPTPRDKSRTSARQSAMSVAVGVPEDEVKFGESAASYASRNEAV